MRFLLRTIIAVLLAASSLPAKTIPQYVNEIEDKTQDLRQLQKAIKEKRLEKEHALLEEKTIQRDLRRLNHELSALQTRREKLRREIKRAEKNLAQAEKDLRSAGWERQQWTSELQREADLWYRAHCSYPSLFCDPLEEQLRLQALAQKKVFIGNAETKELHSRQAKERWQRAQARLTGLKVQQEKTIKAQEKAKAEKKEILKTTIGRRIASEEDIRRLTDSAKALEQLITQLGREKKKTEEELLERRKFAEMKKRLPWPLKGNVVTAFGKSKHPELDTYVISNGIKIQSHPGTGVMAVGGGEVIFAGEFRSYGQMIIIDHGGGFYTLYGNLGEIAVEEDQAVARGTVIGKTGNNGQAALYFEVRSDGKPQDPLLWLISD